MKKQFRPRWDTKVIPFLSKLKEFSVDDQILILQNALTNLSKGDNISEIDNGQSKSIESKLSNRIKTLDDLIKATKIDLNEWFIERHIINKWDVGTKIGEEIVVEELYQVKVWLKKNQEYLDAQKIKNDILHEIKTYSPKVKKINYTDKTDNLLEINIFDLHFGKLATNETTKGTPQDEHLLWQETVKKGRQLMQIGIEYLTLFAPVHVIVVPGNHDWERMFMLGEMLEGWFHNNQNVTIDNSYTPRKYFKYGKCLIGFTHGNNEKAQDLPLIMAQEQSKLWQETKYREFHLGHLHHKREIKYKSTQEYKGIVIRYLRSLCGNDTWHHIKGYVGGIQSAESFVWNKKEGLIANFSYNL